MNIYIPKWGLVIGGVALGVIVLLVLVLSGGGEKSEEAEVRNTMTQLFDAARAGDQRACRSFLDPNGNDVPFVKRFKGDGGVPYCLGAEICMQGVIDRVVIDGDRATVTYVDLNRNTDLMKVDGEWLVESSCA